MEKTPAEAEEETIRLKSLSDLTFPSPPENAAQARGFINQTNGHKTVCHVYVRRRAEGGSSFANGRCMLRAIFRHFQLEWDRIGMLAASNLLSTKLAGGSLQDLEDFREKYLYVLTTIPDADLPKPSMMCNHLIDELEKCPTQAEG